MKFWVLFKVEADTPEERWRFFDTREEADKEAALVAANGFYSKGSEGLLEPIHTAYVREEM